MKSRRAFSLIEVTIAVGIVAFVLVAILGLVPVGMQAAREAMDDTRTSLIAQDAAHWAQALLRAAGTPPASPQAVTRWYDEQGHRRPDPAAWPDAKAFYRVDVRYGPLAAYPAHVDAASLQAATVSIAWPVDPATGEAVAAAANEATFSFYLHAE